MTPRERRSMLLAAALLLAASLVRWGWELRRGPPVLPADSVGVRDELLAETRRARAEEERRTRPLADGERIDPNRADPVELDRLPGVGPAVAGRIVREREDGGPFRSAADLERVRGIGPATARRLAPLLDFRRAPPATVGRAPRDRGRAPAASNAAERPVTAAAPPSPASSAPSTAGASTTAATGASTAAPLDLNRATGSELQALRGIGPALAERILALRREKGGFGSVDELLEVRGIGPRTLERLRPGVRVGR